MQSYNLRTWLVLMQTKAGPHICEDKADIAFVVWNPANWTKQFPWVSMHKFKTSLIISRTGKCAIPADLTGLDWRVHSLLSGWEHEETSFLMSRDVPQTDDGDEREDGKGNWGMDHWRSIGLWIGEGINDGKRA